MKLSPKMKEALAGAAAHSSKGELVRWPGGFWTYPGCPCKPGYGVSVQVPDWWVSTHTITALRPTPARPKTANKSAGDSGFWFLLFGAIDAAAAYWAKFGSGS